MAERVAIVTGAGKGLGRAYALELARQGTAVVVNNRWTDRSQSASADLVVAEIMAAGGQAVASHAAAEDPASGSAMVEQAFATFGRLDAVIANAGVPEAKRFHRQSLEEFHANFAINFFGTLHLVHAAWPMVSEAPAGRVVVSASSAGLHGGDGMTAYSASKAALIGLMRALALEGRAKGVMVNAIAPYAVTAMTAEHVTPALAARMDPAAVAPLVAWLAGPACDVAGEVLVSGGGLLRAAAAHEAAPVRLAPAAVAGSVRSALTAGAWQRFPDAHQAFTALMASDPTPQDQA